MATARPDTPSGFARGIVFHRFRQPGPGPAAQGALTPGQLDRLLRDVGVERILSPAQWLERVAAGTLAPADRCLTFDDGLREQYEYALPVLDRYGLQAFWFVCSSVYQGRPLRSEVYSQASVRMGGMAALIARFLERCPPAALAALRTAEFAAYSAGLRASAPFYSAPDLEYRFIRNRVLTPPQFETVMDAILVERGIDPDELSRGLWLDLADLVHLTRTGHHIGLHSWDHPYELARLPESAQREQYERNHAHLRAVTGVVPVAMSHPLNSYNAQTLAILGRLGIRCGFRANAHPPSGGTINQHPLELARDDAANLVPAGERP